MSFFTNFNTILNKIGCYIGLKIALNIRSPNLLRLILSAGFDCNNIDSSGRTLLHWATIDGDTERVRILLNAGAEVDRECYWGCTALNHAVWEDRTEIIESLIQRGANIDQQDHLKVTPLLSALSLGEIETIELLINMGANVNIANIAEQTPLHVALRSNKNKYIIKKIIQKGGDIDKKDRNKKTPLDFLSIYTNKELLFYALSRQSNLTPYLTSSNLEVNNNAKIIHQERNKYVQKSPFRRASCNGVEIPNELSDEILSFLDFGSIKALSNTSKKSKIIMNRSFKRS